MPSVLWDASKSVIRAKLIALTSHKKTRKKLANLQKNLNILEREHIEKNKPHIQNQLNNVKKEINKLFEEESAKKAAFARHRYYKNGSKALKLLA